jgi:hypothetical protein
VSSEKRHDLHGCEREPFPGFDEETTYLERVTITTAAKAKGAIADEYLVDPSEIHLSRIYMRWVTDGDDLIGPCWFECSSDHPDAVPFWKDAP